MTICQYCRGTGLQISDAANWRILGHYDRNGRIEVAAGVGSLGYRWDEERPVPPVRFSSMADALAAAAFASEMPAGVDTLHLVTLHGAPTEGVIWEVVAGGALDGGTRWLVSR